MLGFRFLAGEVDSVLQSRRGLNGAMRRLIAACERAEPHPDWARLAAVDYAADVPRLRVWFDRVLATDPPPIPLRGLFFDVHQPAYGRGLGKATADLHLVGTAEYDPDDDGLEWLGGERYDPPERARSAALHALYGIAYGTHDWRRGPRPGVLGNDAEYPLGMSFGLLVAREVLRGRTARDLPTDAARVGVVAGFGEGDIWPLGELTSRGLRLRFRPPC